MALSNESPEQSIARQIPKLIEAEVQKIVEQEAAAAAERVKSRVGELTARVASTVTAALSIDIEGAQVVVKLNGQPKVW